MAQYKILIVQFVYFQMIELIDNLTIETNNTYIILYK